MSSEKVSDKAARWAAILFLPAWAGVLGGELGPDKGQPHIWDKALHFVAYFILAGLVTLALRARSRAMWGLLGLIAAGGALEIIQGLIGRDASAYDEIANTLGVLAGGLVGWAVMAALVDRKSAH